MYQALVPTSLDRATSSEKAVSQSEYTLLKPSMSTTDIVSIVNSTNQEQKYNLLKCHFVLSDIFHFPRNIVQAVIGAFRMGCTA